MGRGLFDIKLDPKFHLNFSVKYVRERSLFMGGGLVFYGNRRALKSCPPLNTLH